MKVGVEMSADKSGHGRRWPWVVVGVVLVSIDLFFVAVLVELVTDSTGTSGRSGGIVITCVLLALLSWLAFVSFRKAARRARPVPVDLNRMIPQAIPGTSRGRRVGGALVAVVFFGIAALIAVIEVIDLVQGQTSGAGGGLTGAAVCAALGTFGVTMMRTPSAARSAQLLAAYGTAQAACQSPSWTGSALDRPVVRQPSWLRAPVDRTVTYREAMSQLPWLLVAGTVSVIAALITVGVVNGAPNGAVAVLFAILLGSAFIASMVIAIFIPFGIRLTGGVLTVGALGVPRIGRGWRRQDIPLEEVIAWTVCPRTRAKTEIPRSPFADGDVPIQPLGKRIANWGNLTGPGVRHTLIVRVDPARVPAVMPVVIMMGYGVQPTARSSRDIGVYVIGTRRPQRWTETLERAMPGRRSLT